MINKIDEIKSKHTYNRNYWADKYKLNEDKVNKIKEDMEHYLNMYNIYNEILVDLKEIECELLKEE